MKRFSVEKCISNEEPPVFQIRIRIGSGFNQISGSGSRIRIQEDKKRPIKIHKEEASLVAWTSFLEV
jgi:hypothetical protein